jgi:hypothetical protein
MAVMKGTNRRKTQKKTCLKDRSAGVRAFTRVRGVKEVKDAENRERWRHEEKTIRPFFEGGGERGRDLNLGGK